MPFYSHSSPIGRVLFLDEETEPQRDKLTDLRSHGGCMLELRVENQTLDLRGHPLAITLQWQTLHIRAVMYSDRFCSLGTLYDKLGNFTPGEEENCVLPYHRV